MTEFRIFETAQFARDLRGDFQGQQEKLRAKLNAIVYPHLRATPYSGANIRKLQGYHPDTWRYRIGPYRLFYTIDPAARIVSILTIEHRRQAYR